MKKVILSLMAMVMTGAVVMAQDNSTTSGNKPTGSGSGYTFEFNGTAADNCANPATHVPQFAVTGYTTGIDEVNHKLEISTSGAQQNFIKFSFYSGNCTNTTVDMSDNVNQLFAMEITSDTIIPQLLVIFYDNTGAATDLDPLIFENVPAGTTVLTQSDPTKFVFKGWAPSAPYPTVDSAQVAAVGFQIRKAWDDKTISAATSISYIYSGDAAATSAVNNATVNNSLISVYPNPAKDQINVDLSSLTANNATVKIMNANGTVVYEKATANSNEVINTASFNKGMYMVQVSAGNKISNKKLVIE